MDGLVRKMGIGIGWDIDNSGLVKANNQTDGLVDNANRGSSSFKGLSNAGLMAGNSIRRAFDGAKNSIKSGVNWLENMRYKLGAVAAAGGAAILGLVNQAGKAEETMSKFRVVFGDFANETLDWASDFSRSVGQSELDTARWLSGFQDLLVPMGFAREEATELSKQFVQTGVDLGAFTDETISTEDAMRKLQSGLVGQTDSLRELGITLLEKDIKETAYRKGIAETGAELTKQQKALAVYMGVVEQSRDSIGQGAETQDQWARRTEAFRGILKDLSVEMGGFFMPTFSRGLGLVNEFLYSLRNSRMLRITAGFVGVITVVAGLGAVIGTLSFLWGALSAAAVAAGTTVAGLITPYLLVGAAVVGLALVIQDLWVGFQGGESVIFNLIGWFGEFFGITEEMKTAFNSIKNWFTDMIGDLIQVGEGFLQYYKGIGQFIYGIFTFDKALIIEGLQNIKDGFIKFFTGLGRFVFDAIAGFDSIVKKAGMVILKAIWNVFSNVGLNIVKTIKWGFESAWEGIKGWFVETFDFGGLIRAGLESAINVLPGFLQDKAKGLLGFDNNNTAEDEIEKEAQRTQRQIQNNNRSVNNNVSVGEIKVEAADNPEETGRAVRKELETFLGMEAAEAGV
ncbi:MAG: hypothetical protein FH762_19645 [Firmicutes bacterium]|nr:hypothetical protein [Bacillota bacterium]